MYITPKVIEDYIISHSAPESELMYNLDRETHLKVQMPHMSSGHMQGLFLEMISTMIKPRRVLEVGTFTGYATLSLATGLVADGLIYTLDINEELTSVFTPYFQNSGYADMIKFISGPALQTIASIDEEFDLVFIDADKHNYAVYYDMVFPKVKVGGYILADNVLWDGLVAKDPKDKDTMNIHKFNTKIHSDTRIKNVIVPIRDGINLIQKLRD